MLLSGLALPPIGSSRCWRTAPLLALLPPVDGVEGCWRVTLPLLLPLRELLPLRLIWPLGALLPEDRLGCALRFCAGADGWLLRLTEPRPFVLPDWPELLIWEDGADIEEEGRLPPLLRELPPPDPPRELLPPLV